MSLEHADLVEALKAALTEIQSSNCHNCIRFDDEHISEHDWLRAQIKAQERKELMYREIRTIVMQWSIPVIGTALFLWLQKHLRFLE